MCGSFPAPPPVGFFGQGLAGHPINYICKISTLTLADLSWIGIYLALVPPFYLDAVVALAVPDKEGKSWIGTGFLFGMLRTTVGENSTYTLFLVTNKHVVSEQKIIFARFDGASGGTLEFDIPTATNGRPTWIEHPDREIDICVVRLNADVLNQKGAKYGFFRSDKHTIDKKSALQAGISEGDGIFMLGYPMGLVGRDQNYVLCREGSVARIRDCLHGKSKNFLGSVLTFPGNSGGPVITKPEVVSIENTKAYGRSSLIGIVAAYLPYSDVAISAQTRRPRIIFEENSGLTVIYPVDYILEAISAADQQHTAEAKPTAST